MAAIDFPAPLKFEAPPRKELFNQGVAPTDHSICVVIPHFQQEQYLSRALHSVVPQLGPRDVFTLLAPPTFNHSLFS